MNTHDPIWRATIVLTARINLASKVAKTCSIQKVADIGRREKEAQKAIADRLMRDGFHRIVDEPRPPVGQVVAAYDRALTDEEMAQATSGGPLPEEGRVDLELWNAAAALAKAKGASISRFYSLAVGLMTTDRTGVAFSRETVIKAFERAAANPSTWEGPGETFDFEGRQPTDMTRVSVRASYKVVESFKRDGIIHVGDVVLTDVEFEPIPLDENYTDAPIMELAGDQADAVLYTAQNDPRTRHMATGKDFFRIADFEPSPSVGRFPCRVIGEGITTQNLDDLAALDEISGDPLAGAMIAEAMRQNEIMAAMGVPDELMGEDSSLSTSAAMEQLRDFRQRAGLPDDSLAPWPEDPDVQQGLDRLQAIEERLRADIGEDGAGCKYYGCSVCEEGGQH